MQKEQPHYFVCNIAEGEPGSFKDHALLKNPHQILEATAIAAFSMGAQKAFVYLRGSFRQEETVLNRAYEEAVAAKLLGADGPLGVEIVIHRGEDSYIAGEETAMLESLEGKPAIPRTKPPRPHESGLWGFPTAVNNVETICNIMYIVLYGAGRLPQIRDGFFSWHQVILLIRSNSKSRFVRTSSGDSSFHALKRIWGRALKRTKTDGGFSRGTFDTHFASRNRSLHGFRKPSSCGNFARDRRRDRAG